MSSKLDQKIKNANPIQGPYLLEITKIIREQSARDSYPVRPGLETAPYWPRGLMPDQSYVSSYPKATVQPPTNVGSWSDGYKYERGPAPPYGSPEHMIMLRSSLHRGGAF